MLKLDQEFHKAHSELANTIGGLNTALRTTSQATGDVAASEGHCESCNIIVDDCDTCVLKALNGNYGGGVTICAIDKTADTFRCTFGSVPINCPLIKNDIVVKLKKGARVMSPIEGQEE